MLDSKRQSTVSLINKGYVSILSVFGVVGFLAGFYYENIQILVSISLIGLLLAMLFAVPPWPFLNADNVKWLDPIKIKVSRVQRKKEWYEMFF